MKYLRWPMLRIFSPIWNTDLVDYCKWMHFEVQNHATTLYFIDESLIADFLKPNTLNYLGDAPRKRRIGGNTPISLCTC